MSLVRGLRTILRGSDAKRASAAERAIYAEEHERSDAFTDALMRAYSSTASDAVSIGTALPQRESLAVTAEQLTAFHLLVGPTGCGKSRLLMLLLRVLLRAGFPVLLGDPKSESASLLATLVLSLARELPADQAEALRSRYVAISPFGSSRSAVLPRLNVMAPEDGVDPEAQALEAAAHLSTEIGASVGVRMESILVGVLNCMIRAGGLPVSVLPRLIGEPAILDALAEHHAPAELFRATAARLREESKDRLAGCLARCDRLLRIRSTRLALSAPTCLDVGQLLDDNVVAIDLAPPQGAVDLSRTMCGLIFTRLSHAVRRRPIGSRPTFVALEELPAFLGASGDLAAMNLEEQLRLSRARAVFWLLLTQDVGASLTAVSSSLPQVIRANVHWSWVFRCSDDFSHALPVSGRHPKQAPPPWEHERRGGYLERHAELALLKERLQRAPNRICLAYDARSGHPGLFMKTANVDLRATEEEVAQLERPAAQHPAVMSVAELEACEEAVHRKLNELLDGRRSREVPDRPLMPRRRGPVDIG